MSQRRWPKRFREQQDARRGVPLASLFEACSEAADPSEDVVRRAARVALRSQPAGAGVGAKLSRWPEAWLDAFWASCARQLNARRVLAAVALVALLQLGLAFAAEHGWRPLGDVRLWSRSPRATPAPSVPAALPALAPEAIDPALPLSVALASPDAPAIEPLPPAPIVATPPESTARRHRRTPVDSSWSAAAPARPDPLAAEAGMVSHAIALLDIDPRSALSALSDYRRNFPAGALRGEAALAELRAHLALGDPRAALASLDRLAVDRFVATGGSAAELRISRLELMAGAGRCAEALRALDTEIAAAPSPRLQGRLLLVRASCRSASGNAPGSRSDLRQYLHVLPQGPRSEEVRRRLSGGD